MRDLPKALVTFFAGVIMFLLIGVSIIPAATLNTEKQAFGKMPDGTPVDLYILTNTTGSQVKITNYEGLVVSILVPDHDGNLTDVVLGYDTLEDYLTHSPYFGGITNTVLRVFDHVVWNTREFTNDEGVGLELKTESKQDDQFLGILTATVVYTWTNTNELKIEHTVTTGEEGKREYHQSNLL